MSAMSAFTGAVGEIARLLRENAPSHPVLNRAASQLDQLGRKLHGMGFVHDREIADCFTAAVGGLSACHALPEESRPEAVGEVVRHLEAAMSRMETGGLSP